MAKRKKTTRKPRAPFNPDTWIEDYMDSALSRFWQWWPVRKKFKRKQFLSEDSLASCNHCANRFEWNDTQVDHISPSVPVDAVGRTWDDKIRTKLCFEDNMQLLCKPCHTKKSKIENAERRKFKKNVKA